MSTSWLTRAAAVALVSAAALAPAASAAPPHDDRANAISLQPLDHHTGSNAGGTITATEALTANDPTERGCLDSIQGPHISGWWMGATTWYTVVGDGGWITASTLGSDIDTVLAAYRGNALITCSDDWPGLRDATSQLRFRTQAGVEYDLQLGGACEELLTCAAPAMGPTKLWLTPQPDNDNRAAAAPLGFGSPTNADNFGATEEAGEVQTCDGERYGKTLWYRVSVARRGTLTVHAVDSFHDSVVAVYAGSGRAPLDCNDDSTASASARVQVPVSPGTYYVQAGGWVDDTRGPALGINADDGGFVLSAEFTPAPENRDHDGDGVNRAPFGSDCDDNNPRRRPGLPELANNGLDDNCDNVAAIDADGDGHVSAATGGGDCNDGAGGVHPGAGDVPENRVDEDCSGGDAVYPRITSGPVLRYRLYKSESAIEVVQVGVTDAAPGTTARVVCKGRGCPKRKTQSKTVQRFTRMLRFDIRFSRKLRRSARVTLTITRPGHVGMVRQAVVRRRAVKDTTLCLWPNETKPRRCGG